tara:strand:+ start:12532 stop:13716 length:1185 start_codon:yes stop_codon:yes gene_type:complete
MQSNKVLNDFKHNLSKFNLNREVVIAFSGGSDSSFMLDLFLRLGYKIELAYVNHMLRKDSEAEEEFVKKVAEVNNLTIHVKRVDVSKFAKERKIGIEEAAREVRYDFFNSLKGTIATAHNLDDNLETFIFRLIRGSSINGLRGIPEVRDKYIRPILTFSKRVILNYLHEYGIKYVDDYSNRTNDFTRNKIRNKIFPLFEEINSGFRSKIANFMNDLKEIELDEYSSLIKEQGMNRRKMNQIKKIKDRNGSLSLDISKDRVLRKVYDEIYIENRKNTKPVETSIVLGGSVEFGECKIDAEVVEKVTEDSDRVCHIEYLEGMKVRSRKPGDSFYQKGLDGRKSLKKFLIDRKVNRFVRDNIPIITYNNEIVWVAGYVVSEKFRPKDGKIIRLSLRN